MNQIQASKFHNDYLLLTPFFLFFLLLTLFTSHHIFFWDTVQLGAKHALFYYENNFSKLILPDKFDSGHIPAFGMYLAFCWKVFGKSLQVSHFSMLPFLLGIVWQSYILIRKFINRKYIFLALSIFLADPTLLGQAALVSPDIVLVFLFLTSLNALLRNSNLLLAISITGLILVSMRGMMVAFAMFVLGMLFDMTSKGVKNFVCLILKKLWIYLPGVLLFLVYNIYHYKAKGWIGYHDGSPWAESFAKVDLSGIIYNIGILVWRLWDFGRIFLWGVFLVLLVLKFRVIKKDKLFQKQLIILMVTGACLSVSFILYKYLSGHRYILPIYLIFALITVYLVFEKIESKKTSYILSVILLAGLLSGHFWIYPPKIAQGWDSSLAHLPYYNLRLDMMNYLEENDIDVEEVACTFPNNMEQKFLELNNSIKKHCELDLDKNQYILYSNIYNDFSDEQIDRLKVNFILEKEMERRGVFIHLYRNPFTVVE